MDEWEEREVLQKWAGLLDDRLYLMFVPDPDDPTKFSVEVADTTSSSEQDPDIAKLIVLGIMELLDEDAEGLADRGHARALRNNEEDRQLLFEGFDNVVPFPDIIGSREGYRASDGDWDDVS